MRSVPAKQPRKADIAQVRSLLHLVSCAARLLVEALWRHLLGFTVS